MTPTPIPNRLIFVWLGERFPLTNLIAMRSAVARCRPEAVTLIADRIRIDDPQLQEFGTLPGFRISRPESVLGDDLPGLGRSAWRFYEALDAPAARANLLRLAELWRRGGVYLDTDTITVQDLRSLREAQGFCGLEHIALPHRVVASRRPAPWIKAGLRMAARRVCTLGPAPERWFHPLSRWFPAAVNNAVLGARPENPVISQALERIAALPESERLRRFRLGTHLLQEVTRNRSQPEMTVFDPEAFYPLGPEISVAWFQSGSARRLLPRIRRDTKVVHWYASLESRLDHPLDARWIQQTQQEVAFSRLAAPWLEPLEARQAA